jgi:hypothetical protein
MSYILELLLLDVSIQKLLLLILAPGDHYLSEKNALIGRITLKENDVAIELILGCVVSISLPSTFV